MNNPTKFTGVMPALVTPLNVDETVNVKVLRELIEHLIGEKADGFYVAGATGEGYALKTEERMILAEESVKACAGRKPCIIQVAAADFNDMITLAKHAESCGAAAISATAPMFFQYDEDDVYNYYKTLANAVHIPLMMYYNPNVGFNMSANFAARMFEIDNITAIKWTSSNYYEMIRLKDLTHGEMNILNGPDEMLLMGLNAGADGGIGISYNYMLENFRAIYDCFVSGDMAGAYKAQEKTNRFVAELLKYKLIPTAKLILERKGFAVGNCTFPMKRYTPEEKERIISSLINSGLNI